MKNCLRQRVPQARSRLHVHLLLPDCLWRKQDEQTLLLVGHFHVGLYVLQVATDSKVVMSCCIISASMLHDSVCDIVELLWCENGV